LRQAATPVAIIVVCALLAAGCGGGSHPASGHRGGASRAPGARRTVRLSITPAAGTDTTPNRGITVTAHGGKITDVTVQTAGDPVTGTLNLAGSVWRSTWALDVSRHYTVTATATGSSGETATRHVSFRTFTPRSTFTTEIINGYGQSYGVGMPIILYFSRPIANRAAVERALEVRTSRPVVGS